MSEIRFESYYGVADLGDSYLMHHGIKGMKWGVRRFQNRDGSLTAAGEKRYNTGEGKRGGLADSVKKTYRTVKGKLDESKQARIAKREKAAEEARQNAENLKKQAIATGNLDAIKKHAAEMTTQELQDAINRASLMKRMSEIEQKPKPAGESIMRKAINAGKTMAEAAETVNRIKKAFTGDKKETEEDKKKKALEERTKSDEDYYRKMLRIKAEKAASDARESTKGDYYDKEKAAKKVYDSMMHPEDTDHVDRDSRAFKAGRKVRDAKDAFKEATSSTADIFDELFGSKKR